MNCINSLILQKVSGKIKVYSAGFVGLNGKYGFVVSAWKSFVRLIQTRKLANLLEKRKILLRFYLFSVLGIKFIFKNITQFCFKERNC